MTQTTATNTDQTLREELLDIIEKEGLIRREKLTPDATLESIGVASYDMVMVLMAIEEKYGVYITVDTEFSEAATLGDLMNTLVERIQSGVSDPRDETPLPPPAAQGN